MGLFKVFSRKKDKSSHLTDPIRYSHGRDLTTTLPDAVLRAVFAAVCPHARDESYESCELSAQSDACMLCDLRDLSYCVRVCRRWRGVALGVLYHSIRIDTVHYCPREDLLADKRKRRSFFDRNGEPEDVAQARMRLLCRTLRDDNTSSDGGLGVHVQFLKTPYMTRETCKADLARILAACPNLRYADLPEGFFADDASCTTLRRGVEARCPELRKMTYRHGAEGALASGPVWRGLEVLELAGLNIDPMSLRHILAGLANLRALKITAMPALTDALFDPSPYLLALRELLLEDTPQITATGLLSYLAAPNVAHTLHTLSLTNTGVLPSDLHVLLTSAPSLRHLSIVATVRAPLPTTPPLASPGLRTLHFEITTADGGAPFAASPTTSYYAYLATSLLSDGLPSLCRLYVRDVDFPSSLITFAPPRPLFAADSTNPFRHSTPPGLRRELEVYTKGVEEMEWQFARVGAETAKATRPVSVYGLEAQRGEGGVRRSVVVGDGMGGFLAVPGVGEGRPRSAGGWPGGEGRPRSSAGGVAGRGKGVEVGWGSIGGWRGGMGVCEGGFFTGG